VEICPAQRNGSDVDGGFDISIDFGNWKSEGAAKEPVQISDLLIWAGKSGAAGKLE
jgi:hypothetical protein